MTDPILDQMTTKIAALEVQLREDTAKLAAMHADLHASMTRLDAELAAAIAAIEQRKTEARLGPCYEHNGNCELCNKSGPVWMCEEAETLNQILLCAECRTEAAR